MSDRINDFLDKICASVKYKTMHSEIREEFKNHIDEAVFEFEKFSRGHEAAVNMSLSKLGNATEIGEELNRQYRMPFTTFPLKIFFAFLHTSSADVTTSLLT